MSDALSQGGKVLILPARGGSKRVPRKNLRPFRGRPMIAWAIGSALESGCFDRVIVSTDDEEIAEVSRRWGAEVPFLRPAALADDFATTRAVLEHALAELEAAGAPPSIMGCIYATSVFCRPGDLRRGLALLEASPGVDQVLSLLEFPAPVLRAWRIREDGEAQMRWPEHRNTRSQDLEPLYHDAAQFYLWRCAALRSPSTAPRSLPLVLRGRLIRDIDTEEDFAIAERLFALQEEGERT